LDLLIINSRMMMISSSMVSNGAIAIASYIDLKGKKVRVIDNNSQYKNYSDFELIDMIEKKSPHIVGLSINTLNAYSAYRLMKRIKQFFPNKMVIAGGLHSYDSSHEIMRHGFDIVFKGEAEISLTAFLELVKNYNKQANRELLSDGDFIKSLMKIPGILFRSEDEIFYSGPYKRISNLDELPFINHDLMNLHDYIRIKTDHYGVTNCLNFQRGCPFHCIYCKADFMGGKIRHNSAGYMFKQLRHLYEKYGFNQFNIIDANFPIDKKRMKEFCRLLVASGYSEKIRLWCQTSVTIPLNEQDIKMLKNAGFTMISVGIERFDSLFRKYMKKAGTAEQAINLIKRIKRENIKTNVCILVNFPNETNQSISKESYFLDKYLPYIDYYTINFLAPFPGTKIYNLSKRHKLWYLKPEIVNKKVSYYDLAYNVTTSSLEFNLFNLPLGITREMRFFKERFYRKSIAKIDQSIIYKLAFMVDICLAWISYHLYRTSPFVENIFFSPLKFLRKTGAKMIMNKFIMK
jgi:anaerobic magnesium-protoporphyrin IX monomethyl ester cyclase